MVWLSTSNIKGPQISLLRCRLTVQFSDFDPARRINTFVGMRKSNKRYTVPTMLKDKQLRYVFTMEHK